MYVNVYIRKDLEQKLMKMAAEQGKSPSTLVREWAKEKLEEVEE